MRYDLAFFLCCCKSFLGDTHKGNKKNKTDPNDPDNSDDNDNDNNDEDDIDNQDFYQLLGVERDASPDELKRAYKKRSLQMHPDKLAQRGQIPTDRDQTQFTRMKEAYEVLSDSHKKETYDAIGERGMKWLEEPFSIDPQELAHNFATSSALDRLKIFMIFVVIAIVCLILPVLVCLHVDGIFGPEASWMATLVPLWIWNLFILFYHFRVISMGPIPKPDHIPQEEWIDPLPMKKRIFSMIRFSLIVLFEVFVALKMDSVVTIPWVIIFFPLYVWECTTLYKKWPLAKMRIVTVDDLEIALGKSFAQFTQAEKELIGKRYSVVPSTNSPEFDVATKLKTRARHDIIKSAFRIVFCVVLLIQIDLNLDWNWWLVFLPFWIMTFLICYANYQAFNDVQQQAMLKDPTLFGGVPNQTAAGAGGGGDVETGAGGAGAGGTGAPTATGYGAVGADGAATADDAAAKPQPPPPPLTEQEREELKAQVMASSSRLCSKCCSQGFLLFVVMLFVAKLQGATFSSLWIISPFLAAAGIILCCLGCAIFGITEVPTDGLEFDSAAANFGGPGAATGGAPQPQPTATPGLNTTTAAAAASKVGAAATTATSSTPIYVPPPPPSSSQPTGGAANATSAVNTRPDLDRENSILERPQQAAMGQQQQQQPQSATTPAAIHIPAAAAAEQQPQRTTGGEAGGVEYQVSPHPAVVDLLDDYDVVQMPAEQQQQQVQQEPHHIAPGEIHELD